jgi:hypothetical protein
VEVLTLPSLADGTAGTGEHVLSGPPAGWTGGHATSKGGQRTVYDLRGSKGASEAGIDGGRLLTVPGANEDATESVRIEQLHDDGFSVTTSSGSNAQHLCYVAWPAAPTERDHRLPTTVTLDDLQLSPLDLLYLTQRDGQATGSTLERRIGYHLFRTRETIRDPATEPPIPETAELELTFRETGASEGDQITIAAFLELVRSLRSVILERNPLDADDLGHPGETGVDSYPGDVAADVRARAETAHERLAAVKHLLDNRVVAFDPGADPDMDGRTDDAIVTEDVQRLYETVQRVDAQDPLAAVETGVSRLDELLPSPAKLRSSGNTPLRDELSTLRDHLPAGPADPETASESITVPYLKHQWVETAVDTTDDTVEVHVWNERRGWFPDAATVTSDSKGRLTAGPFDFDDFAPGETFTVLVTDSSGIALAERGRVVHPDRDVAFDAASGQSVEVLAGGLDRSKTTATARATVYSLADPSDGTGSTTVTLPSGLTRSIYPVDTSDAQTVTLDRTADDYATLSVTLDCSTAPVRAPVIVAVETQDSDGQWDVVETRDGWIRGPTDGRSVDDLRNDLPLVSTLVWLHERAQRLDTSTDGPAGALQRAVDEANWDRIRAERTLADEIDADLGASESPAGAAVEAIDAVLDTSEADGIESLALPGVYASVDSLVSLVDDLGLDDLFDTTGTPGQPGEPTLWADPTANESGAIRTRLTRAVAHPSRPTSPVGTFAPEFDAYVDAAADSISPLLRPDEVNRPIHESGSVQSLARRVGRGGATETKTVTTSLDYSRPSDPVRLQGYLQSLLADQEGLIEVCTNVWSAEKATDFVRLLSELVYDPTGYTADSAATNLGSLLAEFLLTAFHEIASSSGGSGQTGPVTEFLRNTFAELDSAELGGDDLQEAFERQGYYDIAGTLAAPSEGTTDPVRVQLSTTLSGITFELPVPAGAPIEESICVQLPDGAVVTRSLLEQELSRRLAHEPTTDFCYLLSVFTATHLDPFESALQSGTITGGSGSGTSGFAADLAQSISSLTSSVRAQRTRIDRAADAGDFASAFRRGMLESLRRGLLRASYFGVYGAVPHSATGGTVDEQERLVDQARGIREKVDERLAASREHTPNSKADATVDGQIERLQAIFGDEFQVLPPFKPSNMTELESSFGRSRQLQDGDPLAVETWLQRIARVREQPAAFRRATTYAESLTPGRVRDLQVGQIPHRPHDRWVGLDGVEPDPGKTSLIAQFGNGFDGTFSDGVAGFMVDEYVENVPKKDRKVGVAMNYDDPNTEAPQSMLVATPHPGEDWEHEEVVDLLRETIDLMKVRMVDLYDLDLEQVEIDGQTEDVSELARLFPALYFPESTELVPPHPVVDFDQLATLATNVPDEDEQSN